jgi:hypothetical protein
MKASEWGAMKQGAKLTQRSASHREWTARDPTAISREENSSE